MGGKSGNFFLGGHCSASRGGLQKDFRVERPHTQVRVQARFHFIDNWEGESAFFKVDGEYVWLDSHSNSDGKQVLSLCGNPNFSDSRLGALIDVVVPHTGDVLNLAFGSTLLPEKDTCNASWGVDYLVV